MKFVSRGDTAVVDAYLSPTVGRYVDQVVRELGPDVRLSFMQSHGGLVAADAFRGKDAILSGPAGGIVGMSHVAAEIGLDRVIGFDMGGTSTDVSHYAGALERILDSNVAGVHLAHAGPGHPHRCRRRRLNLPFRRRPLPCWPAIGRRQPRTSLLSPRRATHCHRLQRHARRAAACFVSARLRPEQRPAARRRDRAGKVRRAQRRDRRGERPDDVRVRDRRRASSPSP